MGVNLRDIISHEPLEFEQLRNKTIAIDALNSIYQFLASIRQPDGTPLMDSHGNTTSHLSGLFYRTGRLLKLGIKPIYVFDGEPSKLKRKELAKRKSRKEAAMAEWKRAKREGRIDDARKYAVRTSRFTDEMRQDSIKLLKCMGIPYIQAPSEGEAQCVHVCKHGDAWAVGSQDYDSLLLGAPRLVKGLTLSGNLELSKVEIDNVLKELGITRQQLIDLAILVGTDFNEGIKGIGPKKALKIVRENRIGELDLGPDVDEVRELFLRPKITKTYELSWRGVDADGLVDLLCGGHDFSETRVRKTVQDIEKSMSEFSQQDLNKWF